MCEKGIRSSMVETHGPAAMEEGMKALLFWEGKRPQEDEGHNEGKTAAKQTVEIAVVKEDMTNCNKLQEAPADHPPAVVVPASSLKSVFSYIQFFILVGSSVTICILCLSYWNNKDSSNDKYSNKISTFPRAWISIAFTASLMLAAPASLFSLWTMTPNKGKGSPNSAAPWYGGFVAILSMLTALTLLLLSSFLPAISP